MIHNIDGVPRFFTPSLKHFSQHTKRAVEKFLKDKTIPLRFVINIGVDGGNDHDKWFIAMGIVNCMNTDFDYNVELDRKDVTFIVKECCYE